MIIRRCSATVGRTIYKAQKKSLQDYSTVQLNNTMINTCKHLPWRMPYSLSQSEGAITKCDSFTNPRVCYLLLAGEGLLSSSGFSSELVTILDKQHIFF